MSLISIILCATGLTSQ